MLAEDNEAGITSVADYLAFKNFRVLVARTGTECLQLAAAEHPDLILMDIQLPELDGLAAMKHLRQMADVAHTPIIALTAFAMLGDRERCLASGADAYLSKPLSLRELVRSIEQVLRPT